MNPNNAANNREFRKRRKAERDRMTKALKAIGIMGRKYPGHGYSCASLAIQALETDEPLGKDIPLAKEGLGDE